MPKDHIADFLALYCHDELPAAESRRVAEHLLGCRQCREAYEEIKHGIALAEQLPKVSAPSALWNNIERSLDDPAMHDVAALNSRSRFQLPAVWSFGLSPATAAAVSLAVLLMSVVGVAWYYSHQSTLQVAQDEREPVSVASSAGDPWSVARVDGQPKVGDSHIAGSGLLATGEWIETDSNSRARLQVADIGQVEIDPNTRLQLVKTNEREHRLALARGRLRALILAPPRLFFVDTPSGVAVDYGCAYTLEVDDAGGSRLHVTAGWVQLELRNRESMVPAGAVCLTKPGTGPGTPYFADASPILRGSLEQLDFKQGGRSALEVVLKESRPRDTLTLWHLLARADVKDRHLVYDRLAALVPPPAGVNRNGVLLRLDQEMLDLWKEELQSDWF